MHNTTGYASVISGANNNARSKSQTDWMAGSGIVGQAMGAKGNQTMLHLGNQSMQNIVITGNPDGSQYASLGGGAGGAAGPDSFYVD